MNTLAQPLAELIFECFHSIEALDVFIALQGAFPAAVTARELVARTGATEGCVVATLQHLVATSLAAQIGSESPPRYVLLESPRISSSLLAQLDDALTNDRLAVVALLGQQAIRRLREQALIAFRLGHD